MDAHHPEHPEHPDPPRPDPNWPHDQWEYLVLPLMGSEMLNKLGREGWELCLFVPHGAGRDTHQFYFKRHVPFDGY